NEEVAFGKALIATGANVRRLNVPGCELEQIYYLRTLANADAIREGVSDAEEVVLIGGSYIACEVAASLTMLGKNCTIVMQGRASRSASAAACAAHRGWRARSRGCSRRATSASTTRSCTAAPRCASSTGTWPSITARRPR